MTARAVTGPLPAAVASPVPTLAPVLGALAIASLVELLVLRTFTRTAVHIPALSAMRRPYEFISTFGRYSYFVAAVLLVVGLPFAGKTLWERGDLRARTAAVAIALFGMAAIAARSDALNIVLVDALTVGAVVLAASATVARRKWRTTLVVAAFAAAFACRGTSSMLQDAASEGFGSFDTRWLLWAAEWLALMFAVASPIGLTARPSRGVLVVAAFVSALIFAALLANGSTAKVLLLWNEGLAGTLPSAGYALAAGTLVAAVLGLLRQHRSQAAIGLVLLVTGGIGLHSTYQTGLVVTGLAVLCLAASDHAPNEPAPAA